jgi:magnesium-transporting ATPase (P-type)
MNSKTKCNSVFVQALYDGFYITFYNVTFTFLPIVLFGITEQDLSADTLLAHPENYKKHRKNKLMTWGKFMVWVFLGETRTKSFSL